jgi:hypothetical protein
LHFRICSSGSEICFFLLQGRWFVLGVFLILGKWYYWSLRLIPFHFLGWRFVLKVNENRFWYFRVPLSDFSFPSRLEKGWVFVFLLLVIVFESILRHFLIPGFSGRFLRNFFVFSAVSWFPIWVSGFPDKDHHWFSLIYWFFPSKQG